MAMWLCLIFLLLFLAVASTDGFYFHLYKYRLYSRPASRKEHLLHTVNSALLPPQIFLMFCARPQGAWLWVTAVLAIVILGIEIWDVICEPASRASLGGLTPAESAMHFFMGVTRSAYVIAFFAPLSWTDFSSEAALFSAPFISQMVGYSVIVPGIGVAMFHALLWQTGRHARMEKA